MKKLILFILLTYAFLHMASSQTCLPNGIIFTTQSQIDSFHVNHPNCTEITGYVSISGSDINNFDNLIVLNSIGGDLSIDAGPLGQGHHLLKNFSGFDSLASIGGNFYVKFNDSLSSFSGMENLNSIGGDLVITSNDAITNLLGLNNLNTIDGSLEIWGNDSLTKLTGLENLTSISGSLVLGGYMGPILFGNPQLLSLTALNNLSSIGGDIVIRKQKNLSSLDGLENIEANSIYGLSIYENQNLSTCDVLSICDYLSTPNSFIDIYDNASGCDSQEQVEEACSVGITSNNAKPEINIYPNPTTKEFYFSNNERKIIEVNIYNIFGQIVLCKLNPHSKVDVSSLKSGIYLVKLKTNKKNIKEKLVIK